MKAMSLSQQRLLISIADAGARGLKIENSPDLRSLYRSGLVKLSAGRWLATIIGHEVGTWLRLAEMKA